MFLFQDERHDKICNHKLIRLFVLVLATEDTGMWMKDFFVQERTRSSLLEVLYCDLQKKSTELMSPNTLTSSRSEGSRLIDSMKSMKRAFSSKGRSQTVDAGVMGSGRRPNSGSTPLPSLGEDDRNTPPPVSNTCNATWYTQRHTKVHFNTVQCGVPKQCCTMHCSKS